jgi:hypothetical protein
MRFKRARRVAFAGLLATVGGIVLGITMRDAVAQNTSAPTAQPEIDLKLFETSEVDRSKGCSVALWQSNRDPDKDKFAFIFTENLTGRNHARQPARIKIAGQAVTLTRVATGGKTTGYGLFPYQLYRIGETDDFVVLDLKLAEEAGEAVDIESGTMSIIMRGRQVFRASVKGGAGCNTPAAAEAAKPAAPRAAAAKPPEPAPPVTNNDMAGMFERYTVRAGQVPRVMTQAMAKQFGCEAVIMRRPVIGYQMSEESAIWQIPCGEYAAGQVSAIFALVYVTDPAKQYTFLPFKWPKGQNRGLGDNAMMEPKWDLKTRTVTSINTEGNGKDCGSLERHKVTEDGTFQLVELRYREMCDGKNIGVENFPVTFKAR